MKKMILAAALLAVSSSAAMAQDEFAPKAGDFSVEVQFNPFSDDFGTFKIDQLKGRYFFGDKDALRFGIGFGINNSKLTPDPDNAEDNWGKSKSGNFSIDLGYERHFFNYKRVNLYAGAGLGFALQSCSTTTQYVDNGTTYEVKKCNEANGDRSFTEFNVKAFTGIDFYVYKGLFVGAELGIKLGFQNYPGYYTKGGVDPNTGNWNADFETAKQDKVNGFNLNTYIEPALRLGWTF